MLDLNIVGSEINPSIFFSKEKGILKIEGNSVMEDAKSFYTVVINWLKDYTKNPNEISNFEIRFFQLNQASLKMLLFVFQEIKSLQIDGHKIKVNWCFAKNQSFIKEMGQDISSMTDVYLNYSESATTDNKSIELAV